MGRIFETRKATMFARWNRMAKQFARIVKDINMAVKSGGPDPQSNPTLLQAASAVDQTRGNLIQAGLNPNPGAVERLGIEQTFGRAGEADLILVVLDASLPSPALPDALVPLLTAGKSITVLNKLDLVGKTAMPPAPLERGPIVRVSALTGEGIEELTQAIVRLAEAFDIDQHGDDRDVWTSGVAKLVGVER